MFAVIDATDLVVAIKWITYIQGKKVMQMNENFQHCIQVADNYTLNKNLGSLYER